MCSLQCIHRTDLLHSPHPPPPTMNPDLAEFCEFVIASLFDVAPAAAASTSSHSEHGQREGIDTPPYTPPPEGSEVASSRKEPPLLVEFVVSHPHHARSSSSRLNANPPDLSRVPAWEPEGGPRVATRGGRSNQTIAWSIPSHIYHTFDANHVVVFLLDCRVSRPTHSTELAYLPPSSIKVFSFYRV